ncbi:MAG: protein phosphatase 2C family protein, partial [Clostridia bacterium]|nr:protein phosphatase 2C family protein [Clostridia bacterium]
EALPVGILPEARTAVFDTDLRRGDVVIMMSDGAADALGKDLPESVARITPENEPVIAAKLLVELAARAGGRDDMTVIVAKTQ